MRSTSIFKLGRDLNQRDTIAVKHTVSGLLKLLYPARGLRQGGRPALPGICPGSPSPGEGATQEDRRHGILRRAFLLHRHGTVGGEVHQRAGTRRRLADPRWPAESRRAAHGRRRAAADISACTASKPRSRRATGRSRCRASARTRQAKEAIKVGFDYFKANASRVSASIKPGDHDYHLHVVELHNTGPTTAMTLSTFVALCSGGLGQAAAIADGGPGQHEPGREHHPGREPGRVAPGRLRRRGQTHPPADGQREGHPDDPRRTVRQVPDQFLRRPRSMRCSRRWGWSRWRTAMQASGFNDAEKTTSPPTSGIRP